MGTARVAPCWVGNGHKTAKNGAVAAVSSALPGQGRRGGGYRHGRQQEPPQDGRAGQDRGPDLARGRRRAPDLFGRKIRCSRARNAWLLDRRSCEVRPDRHPGGPGAARRRRAGASRCRREPRHSQPITRAGSGRCSARSTAPAIASATIESMLADRSACSSRQPPPRVACERVRDTLGQPPVRWEGQPALDDRPVAALTPGPSGRPPAGSDRTEALALAPAAGRSAAGRRRPPHAVAPREPAWQAG